MTAGDDEDEADLAADDDVRGPSPPLDPADEEPKPEYGVLDALPPPFSSNWDAPPQAGGWARRSAPSLLPASDVDLYGAAPSFRPMRDADAERGDVFIAAHASSQGVRGGELPTPGAAPAAAPPATPVLAEDADDEPSGVDENMKRTADATVFNANKKDGPEERRAAAPRERIRARAQHAREEVDAARVDAALVAHAGLVVLRARGGGHVVPSAGGGG